MNEKEISKKLHNLVTSEDGLLVILRCENYFDDEKYNEIRNILKKLIPIWKERNSISPFGLLAVASLIEQIAGENRFLSETDSIKTEDACIEIMDIINDLYD